MRSLLEFFARFFDKIINREIKLLLAIRVPKSNSPLILLHGWLGSWRYWMPTMEELSEQHRTYALDLWGFGDSDKSTDRHGVDKYVNLLKDFMDELGVAPAALVGHSLGGFVALEFALKYPDKLAALVLVDTSSGQFAMDPNYAQMRGKLDELARSQGMEAAFEYDVASNPMRVEVLKKHPEMKEVMRRKMLMTSVDGYIYGSRSIGKWAPVTPRLAEIRVPTLIFWGDEDIGFTEAVQTLQAGIAGSELITVKGVGHSPHEDAPDIFNEAMLKFLDRVSW